MTGGIGRKALTNFYRDHFILNNPEDTQLELVSRTVGVDRVIDEFIFCFTHDKVIDWLFVLLSLFIPIPSFSIPSQLAKTSIASPASPQPTAPSASRSPPS
jgi:hypothetical protein